MLQGRFAAGGPRLPMPGSGTVQRQVDGNAQPLPSGLVQLGAGGGRPLPDGVRQKMESFFKADFSDVRVHVGAQAPAIGALAFTLGTNLYFAPGQYNPDTPHGQQLLGHELTHVLQQRAGRVRNPFGSGIAVVQDPSLEAEADRMGMRAAAHALPPTLQAKAASPAGPAIRHAQAKPAQGSGYRLIVGAYLHQEQGLPDAMAGHGFVAVERPGGKREAWGFSPANLSSLDPQRDLGRLTTGVPGRLHRDEAAFSKPGVRTRSFTISAEQAQRAMAKISEYGGGNVQFSLGRRQCTAFAGEVAKAAGVDAFGGGPVRGPRDFYRKI
ncbi:eCIS core domain-containing protein [Azospirillum sp. ST 5-10]|uniref:eCIS core domain-containing protein n=1 Tax=unclassified Azospirillum TaxID=2630922 RepID=UPI003F49E600